MMKVKHDITPKEFFLYKLSPREQKLLCRIIKVIGMREYFGLEDIKRKVGISQNNLLGALLTRLVNKGVLKRVKRGSYRMVNKALTKFVKKVNNEKSI